MLELRHIYYSVEDGVSGRKNILTDINLVFPDGSTTVITGHNGSGKSTLVKLIMGMEKPSAGSIIFNGVDVTENTLTERAKMGFTVAFQQPVRFKGITVQNLLDIACNKSCAHKDACDCLSAVGLCAKNYINRPVDGTLSGGELKRIELAVALAKGGSVFLLDEPEAGIDLWSFDELVKVFEGLKDKTVIIVSHQRRILEAADRITVLNSAAEPVCGAREEILPLLGEESPFCCKSGVKR